MPDITRFQSTIQRELNVSREHFVLQSLEIARTESPYSGGGWLTKLSDFLLEQGKLTTDNILSELEKIKSIIKDSEHKALSEMIVALLDEWIDENMKLSHYRTLLSRSPDKEHLIMIIDYLKNDIRDNVNSTFDKWNLVQSNKNNAINLLVKVARPFQGPFISYVLNHLKQIFNFFAKF
jgi:hypothetical protein